MKAICQEASGENVSTEHERWTEKLTQQFANSEICFGCLVSRIPIQTVYITKCGTKESCCTNLM